MNKGVRLAQVASASRGRYSLNFSDLGAALKPAFDKVFTQVNIMRGWDAAGLIPFTRKPLLLLLKEQESKVTQILCMYHACTMRHTMRTPHAHTTCTHHARTMHTPCTHHTQTMHAPCTYDAHIMCTACR